MQIKYTVAKVSTHLIKGNRKRFYVFIANTDKCHDLVHIQFWCYIIRYLTILKILFSYKDLHWVKKETKCDFCTLVFFKITTLTVEVKIYAKKKKKKVSRETNERQGQTP